MNAPAPLQLARALAAPLAGLDWAIGGSTLLHRLGLEPAPADLDIVTTPEHFAQVRACLEARLGTAHRPAHPRWRTVHFARFDARVELSGAPVDVMAGIAVQRGESLERFVFDARRIDRVDGLPWMRAADWLVLYRLFDRAARVQQLEAWLAAAPGRMF
jgi:hypothetical protein